MLVRQKFAYILLLLENDHFLLRSLKKTFFGRTSLILDFLKKQPLIVLMRNQNLVLVLKLDSYSENASIVPLYNPWSIRM